MHIDEVILAGQPPLRLPLHRRLTVVTGCPPDDRREICAALPPAFYGFDVASIVRWVDNAGERHLVCSTDAVVPKLSVISPAQLDGTADRVLDLLARARVPATSMAPGLAVLDEPFGECSARQTWELLDLVLRLSEKVQTLLLSADECVRAWTDRNHDSVAAIDLVAEMTSDPSLPVR